MNKENIKQFFYLAGQAAKEIKNENNKKNDQIESIEIELKIAETILNKLSENKHLNVRSIIYTKSRIESIRQILKEIKKKNNINQFN
ncbi:hypothetical protein K9L67_02895 [Candidatus Woesearchaeota archaeon]|nr:hypothetical protein [Candidatus Woesearchaeota archaeon]MCF7901148.1 hypothetical protein [Candidatus Woesearchaeota archaeon]MCF8013675.1 hypothetical protein [Candidatus Woesearchaeota archaeon]